MNKIKNIYISIKYQLLQQYKDNSSINIIKIDNINKTKAIKYQK